MAYNALEKHYQYALSELRQKTEQLKKSLFLYLHFTCARIEAREKEIIQKILKEKFYLDNILDFELTYINSEIKIKLDSNEETLLENPTVLDHSSPFLREACQPKPGVALEALAPPLYSIKR